MVLAADYVFICDVRGRLRDHVLEPRTHLPRVDELDRVPNPRPQRLGRVHRRRPSLLDLEWKLLRSQGLEFYTDLEEKLGYESKRQSCATCNTANERAARIVMVAQACRLLAVALHRARTITEINTQQMQLPRHTNPLVTGNTAQGQACMCNQDRKKYTTNRGCERQNRHPLVFTSTADSSLARTPRAPHHVCTSRN